MTQKERHLAQWKSCSLPYTHWRLGGQGICLSQMVLNLEWCEVSGHGLFDGVESTSL